MKVKRSSLIIKTERDGGYTYGYCAVCKKSGWLHPEYKLAQNLKHKKHCPIGTEAKFVEIKEEAY